MEEKGRRRGHRNTMKVEEGEGKVWQGLEPSTIAGFEDL